jgi:alpha-glucosidase
MNGRRPLVLTRAAFSGAQRYTTIWTGDNVASDEHMMLGCRLVNSLGISGMPFAGVDVGGFAQEATASLFARWMTIGTFTPFFRVHKAYNQNTSEPWTYGEDVETIARNYISLRYRLLPYLYSSFYESLQSGLPVSRALIIGHEADETCWTTDFQHQYMFGPSLLVAPVESTQRFARVYLPAGDWYDFFTGKKYEGGKETLVEAPLDKLPVFASGGSFIHMQSVVQSTSEKPSDTLFLHVYNGNVKNQFLYYEDDALTYEYEKGMYLTKELVFDPSERQIFIGKSQGNYTGKFLNITLILHGFDIPGMNWQVNHSAIQPQTVMIDLYSALNDHDPLHMGGREYDQQVQVVHLKDFGDQQIISW